MAAKLSKRSKALAKSSKVAEEDTARCQKVIDRQVARALEGTSRGLPQIYGMDCSYHNEEWQFALPEASDSRPPQSLSPDGATEQLLTESNLPSNNESLYGSLQDPFSASTASQQPIGQCLTCRGDLYPDYSGDQLRGKADTCWHGKRDLRSH